MTARAAYPSGVDYSQSMQNVGLTLRDPLLRTGDPDVNAMGLPIAISGAFASVFRITTPDGRRWAVKCFTRNVPDRDARYRAISTALDRLNRPWQVHFEYQDEGVLVGGAYYPIIKMEWIDAEALTSWIDSHLWESDRMSRMAAAFADLALDLDASDISHGDLQHGNLLVAANDQLRLIDYDGMFVPGMEALGAAEKGHRNYQPPTRVRQFGPHLDRFSAWVIWAALVALSIDPHLWYRLRSDGDEKLIFGEDDYNELLVSPALTALRKTNNADLVRLADAMSPVLRGGVGDVKPIELGLAPRSTNIGTTGAPLVVGPSGTPSSGRPSWMQPPTAATATAAGGVDWIAGHLPLPAQKKFGGSLRGPRTTALASVAVAVLALLVLVAQPAAIGAPLAPILIALLSLPLVVTLLAAEVGYRRSPERANKGQATSALRGRTTEVESARKALAVCDEESSGVDSEAARAVEQLNEQKAKVRTNEQNRLSELDRRTAATLTDLRGQRTSLDSSVGQQRQQALAQLQDDHLRRILASKVIRRASIYGIGSSLTTALAQHGINTAADFTGVTVRMSGGRYQNEIAMINRRAGGPVKVPGIGPVKARDLESWRKQQVQSAQRSQPTALSQADEKGFRDRIAAERARIEQAERDTTAASQRERASISTDANRQIADLDRQIQQAQAHAASRRANIGRKADGARRDLDQATFAREQAKREVASYEHISRGSYLRAVLVGERS